MLQLVQTQYIPQFVGCLFYQWVHIYLFIIQNTLIKQPRQIKQRECQNYNHSILHNQYNNKNTLLSLSLPVRLTKYNLSPVPMEESTPKIKVVTKKAYSILQKLFCCMCFHCLRADDESMLTSDIRKQTFQRMIKSFVIDHQVGEHHLFDPLKLMIIIYLCEDKQIPHRVMQHCRLNPDLSARTRNRIDIEFYIPQICNFVVFHEDLTNKFLMEDMLTACKLNYFFAHLYYFYMNSLEKIIVNKFESQTFEQVEKYNQRLLDVLNYEFEKKNLFINEFYLDKGASRRRSVTPNHQKILENVKKYGTIEQDECNYELLPEADDIVLDNYLSIYEKQKQNEPFSFKSTVNFFQDLFLIAEDIKTADPKPKALKHLLRKMNEKLPGCVYIPFAKIKHPNKHNVTKRWASDRIRLYNVLNIVADESRVFSTKERAPFYICLEIFCPSEQLSDLDKDALELKLEMPVTLHSSLPQQYSLQNLQSRSRRKSLDEDLDSDGRTNTYRNSKPDMKSELLSDFRSHQTQILDSSPHYNKKSRLLSNKLMEFTKSMETSNKDNKRSIEMMTPNNSQDYAERLAKIFGEKECQMHERIRKASLFGHLKTWSLVHMMVKTGDNLKQEQFALQLIIQFNNIFRLENVPLILTPYEVLSMGPDCGIMEMVKDALTIDGLLKKLRENFPKIHSLKEFFEAFYVQDLHKAKSRFTKSLAAYSLVSYFLQIKDRHNGNILLHRDGKIVHIDFGFLLSNAPGKGVELEKSAPFKLNTQYIEVMDGVGSSYFQDFRKYFYQGFQAARKHQDKILIIVKMMYSSSGMTMPCFEKGEQAIKQLEDRFNPSGIDNDLKLSEHCQKLINKSLDNWATHWYDKWQYWAQGIFY